MKELFESGWFWFFVAAVITIVIVVVILTASKTTSSKIKTELPGSVLTKSCRNESTAGFTPLCPSNLCPKSGAKPGEQGDCSAEKCIDAYGPIPGLSKPYGFNSNCGNASLIVTDQSSGDCIWTQSAQSKQMKKCPFLSSECDTDNLSKCQNLGPPASGGKCEDGFFRNPYYCSGHGTCPSGTMCECDTKDGYVPDGLGGCGQSKTYNYTCTMANGGTGGKGVNPGRCGGASSFDCKEFSGKSDEEAKQKAVNFCKWKGCTNGGWPLGSGDQFCKNGIRECCSYTFPGSWGCFGSAEAAGVGTSGPGGETEGLLPTGQFQNTFLSRACAFSPYQEQQGCKGTTGPAGCDSCTGC